LSKEPATPRQPGTARVLGGILWMEGERIRKDLRGRHPHLVLQHEEKTVCRP
jgi:hypothetical protein